MTFNEQNTIENALRDHLCGRRKDEGGRMNEVREASAPYGSFFIPHNSSLRYQYVYGENLVFYGNLLQNVRGGCMFNNGMGGVIYV